MASCTPFHHSLLNFFPSTTQLKSYKNELAAASRNTHHKSTLLCSTAQPVMDPTSYPLFQPPLPPPEIIPSQMELADPDFYKIGFVRSFRAYGVEFREGPDGFGVFASKDVEPLRRARMIMEIPLELMLTISKKLPWMFFPDIIPIGHPIFDIINSTNPETDWDLRFACLLLHAFDHEDNFWQLYGDFLPSVDECTSLLLATEEDLRELQDQKLESLMREHQRRALEFWEKNWHSAAPLKIKRLARDRERFMWAVGIAQTRSINMQIRIGALVQDANMLVPYGDMLNHSFQPNCFFHWRFKDRMLEVMINPGQRIKRGEEMTVNYLSGQQNDLLMQRYGFSTPVNPWDVISFSGDSRIHLDTFLSVFNITDLPEEYYHNSEIAVDGDDFVDGAVIAAARTLPTWSDGDVPPIPSEERKAAKDLQQQCNQILSEYPTTAKQDEEILGYVCAKYLHSESNIQVLVFVYIGNSFRVRNYKHKDAVKSFSRYASGRGSSITIGLGAPTDRSDTFLVSKLSLGGLRSDKTSTPDARRTREAAIKYRLHRKMFIKKVIDALEIYQDKILF